MPWLVRLQDLAMDSPPVLQIDIVSDVVCPWCYVGKRQLEQAIALWQQDHPDLTPPALRWRPFQLNPDLPLQGMPRSDYLRQKFGSADGGSRYDRVRAAAQAVGLELGLERITVQPNTLKAHGLIELALDSGRQTVLAEAFFKAYFMDGRDLSRDATLREIAAGTGLGDDMIDAVLDEEAVIRLVAAADLELRDYGVTGVPLFIIGSAGGGERLAISGAQGGKALLQAMRQVQQQA
jgi:predicted DsbA family dithiol-disulfide isomerase